MPTLFALLKLIILYYHPVLGNFQCSSNNLANLLFYDTTLDEATFKVPAVTSLTHYYIFMIRDLPWQQ